jgi:glucosamine kinase
MILVADSGSTKTNWLYKQDDKKIQIDTIGFNPLFISSSDVVYHLSMSGFEKIKNQFSEVYFYGASCSSAERNMIIEKGLKEFFKSAKIVKVDHDMTAACIALCGSEPGIACIIGTGSNSCVWNGAKITNGIEAPGFILGDEASGAYFGKKIVALYLYHKLPNNINQYIKENFTSDKNEIYTKVYTEKFPNRFLASYARVLSEFKSEPMIQELLKEGFEEFIKYHLLPYPEIKTHTVSFVGSIASVFKKELESVCATHNIKTGIYDTSPVSLLLKHHSK